MQGFWRNSRMRIFIDSSIVLAFLAGQDERAKRLVSKVEEGAVTGYINPVVIDEVIHGYLRLATGLSSRRIRQLLARRERFLAELVRSDVVPVLELFTPLPLAASPHEVAAYMERYGLMPADAVTALTCEAYGIKTIATLDEDFKRIPWLEVVP